MESNKEKLERWDKESSQMFAGYVINVWMNGDENYVDSNHQAEVEKMEGAEIRPIRLYL